MTALPSGLLEQYREQVLRWNRQISLVSRQETDDRLDRLIAQCVGGIDVLMEANPLGWASAGDLRYFDLGSGGGLPGVVWHIKMTERGLAPRTCLVEPREKRAWFLNRMRGLEGMPTFDVAASRWTKDVSRGRGTDTAKGPRGGNGVQLISLKALKLADPEIIAEIESGPCPSIVIARYYPPGEPWSDNLAESLEIPKPGTEVGPTGAAWVAAESGVLAGHDFSLVISAYRACSS